MLDVQARDVRRLRRSLLEIRPVADDAEQVDRSRLGEPAHCVRSSDPIAAGRGPRILIGYAENVHVSLSGRRVLFYTEATSRGGAEISLRNLIAALEAEVDIAIMGVDASICAWIASARPAAEVILVRAPTHKLALGRLLTLRRQIARAKPDVFQANLRTVADARYAVLAALTVPGVEVVVVEHSPLRPTTRLGRWLKRQTSRRLAAHVAVGDRAARLIEAGAQLPPGSVVVVHNGVPDHGLAAPRAGSNSIVAGTFARLDPDKGIDVLLRAAAALDDVGLLIAGDGPARESLLSEAASNGLSERARFLPWSETTRALLDEIDVFVLPSRLEGFPLSILEAMMAGRPVLATDVGSIREAVADGTTGLVVPAGDTDSLRRSLERLAADPDERRRMGEAGRARAVELFTADRMARSFEQLYGGVLGEEDRSASR
jgi:glycosyltransferase involved in cell wall biosynthesis